MLGLTLLTVSLAAGSLATPTRAAVWAPLPAGFDQSNPDTILALVPHEPLAFDGLYVFGDSACDTGNLFELTENTDPDPDVYWRGRFSNGPMWPDYLQARHQLQARNYAFGGAVVNQKNNIVLDVPDFFEQTKTHLGSAPLNVKRPLAILQFVGNDLINQTVTSTQVARDVGVLVQKLIDQGGIKDFLIVLTSIYDYDAAGYSKALVATATSLNTANKNKAKVNTLATLSLFNKMAQTPPVTANAAIWRDIEQHCFDVDTKAKCTDPENHLYFDNYHPSTVPNYNSAIFISDAIRRLWPK